MRRFAISLLLVTLVLPYLRALMGCAVVLQASLPAATAGFRSPADDSDATPVGAGTQLRSRASPDTPPPKAA